jgi:hypothetical protein
LGFHPSGAKTLFVATDADSVLKEDAESSIAVDKFMLATADINVFLQRKTWKMGQLKN